MEQLFGTTGKFIKKLSEGEKKPFNVFFKPYKNSSDFFYRAAAVVTAPIIYASFSVGCLVFALYNVFKAFYELLKGLFTNQLKAGLKNAKRSAHTAGQFFSTAGSTGLGAIAAPVVELTDVVGSAFNTALKKQPSKGKNKPTETSTASVRV